MGENGREKVGGGGRVVDERINPTEHRAQAETLNKTEEQIKQQENRNSPLTLA